MGDPNACLFKVIVIEAYASCALRAKLKVSGELTVGCHVLLTSDSQMCRCVEKTIEATEL